MSGRPNGMAGLIDHREGLALERMASRVPEWATVVEVGTHTGLSTCWLASGATESGAHVVAIDPFPDPRPAGPGYNDDPFELGSGDAVLELCVANLTAHQAWPHVTVLRTPSLAAAATWVNPIGLLFVDALHTYDAVAADYEAWSPHVAEGGWIAFHDYWRDPQRTDPSDVAAVIEERILPTGLWGEVDLVWNLWCARRTG